MSTRISPDRKPEKLGWNDRKEYSMSRSPLNIALIAAGLCLLLAGLGVWAGPGTSAAYA
jgi:hypothetical protein